REEPMISKPKRQGYVLAVGLSLVVLALRFGFRQPLGEQALLLPFVLAVIVAAARGGLGPGLLATGLCTILGLLFLVPPPFSLLPQRIDHAANVLIFVVIGVIVSGLCQELHNARRRDTEKRFRTLADSIPQLVWMARPDGYRFWFNKRWCEFT